MKIRSIAAPLLLPLITFGIYSLVWLVSTKSEMNRSGVTRIPTAWMLVFPISSLFWTWKYARGVQEITRGTSGRHSAFWMLILLGPIGAAVLQSGYNVVADTQRQLTGSAQPLAIA